MGPMFRRLLGINWKTTMAGIAVLAAVVGKLIAALKAKDFATVFTSGQELIPDITAVLVAVGLFNAKDNDTTGAGDAAKKVSMLLLVGTLCMLGSAAPARAQTKSNELSIGAVLVRQDPHFSRADFKYNQTTDQVGADVSLTHYFGESAFGVTADVGASVKGRSATDASLVTVAIGPTVKARNRKLEPFARVLIGGARLAARNQQLKFDKTNLGFALLAGGGVDWRVSNRFAVRVIQADFLGTRILGSTVKNARVGAGLVFSF